MGAQPGGLDILPESDRYLLSLDREGGVLLRAECYLADNLLAVEEVTEVEFDAHLSSDLFAEPRLGGVATGETYPSPRTATEPRKGAR